MAYASMMRLVGARPEDRRKLLLMTPVFFLGGVAELLNYNGFMTLFNQRFGSENLPYIYAAEAVILPLEAWFMAWLAMRLSKPQLMRVLFLLMLGIVAFNAAVLTGLSAAGADVRWYYPFLFVTSNFVVRQQTILLWSLAVDLCTTQQAKRLMPVFVGAATLGGAAAGAIAQFISLWAGPVTVYAAGVVFLAAALPGYRKAIARYLVPLALQESESQTEDEGLSSREVFRRTLRSPFLLTVVALMTLMPALYFLMEYQFLSFSRETYADEQAFGLYFGRITMLLFVLAFALQFVSGKLMNRFGASQMLTVISVVFVAAFAAAVPGVGSGGALYIVSGGYMMLYLLLYYFAEPSYQLFFKALPLRQRDSFRYAAQGIAASAGIMAGAGLQFLHAGFGVPWSALSAIGVAGAAALVLLAWFGRRLYMRELVGSIQDAPETDLAESFDEFARNPAALAAIQRMLAHPREAAREIALDILGRRKQPKLMPELLALLDDPSPRIRIAALRALTVETGGLPELIRVAGLLNDAEPEVRAEAVRQMAKMKQLEHQSFYFLRQMLLDRHPHVVAEAVKAMYSFGNAPSYEACAEAIDRILDAGGEQSAAICRVIAELGLERFIPKVEALLDQDRPAVRLAAIECLGRLGYAEALPKLIAKLPTMDEELYRVTVEAMTAMGDAAVEPLAAAMEQSHPAVWRACATALARLLSETDVRERLVPSCLQKLEALGQASSYAGALRRLERGDLAELSKLRWLEVRRTLTEGAWAVLGRLADEQVALSIRRAVADKREETRSNGQEMLAEGVGDRRLSQALLAALETAGPETPVSWESEARQTLEAMKSGYDDWWREMAASAERQEETTAVSTDGRMLGRLNKVVFLRQVTYFADLSLEELGLIAGIAEEKTYADNEELLRRGEPNESMYVVIEGNVELASVSAAGWEGTIGVLGPGDVCGVTSAIDGTPSSVTAQSLLGDVRVLALKGEEVSRLIRLYPEIGIGLLRASFARIRLLEEMIMRIDS